MSFEHASFELVSFELVQILKRKSFNMCAFSGSIGTLAMTIDQRGKMFVHFNTCIILTRDLF